MPNSNHKIESGSPSSCHQEGLVGVHLYREAACCPHAPLHTRHCPGQSRRILASTAEPWVGEAPQKRAHPKGPVHLQPRAWWGHSLGNFSAAWVLGYRSPPCSAAAWGPPPRVMLPAREGPCQGLGPPQEALRRQRLGGQEAAATCDEQRDLSSALTSAVPPTRTERKQGDPEQKEAAEAG